MAKVKVLQFNPSQVRKIFERDGGICIYCGGFAQEIDHVISVKDGGPTILSNGVCACKHCNNHKAGNPKDAMTYLTKAIFWLMQKGEDTNWMDEFYK